MEDIRLAFMSSEKDSLIDRKLIVLGGKFSGRGESLPARRRKGPVPAK